MQFQIHFILHIAFVSHTYSLRNDPNDNSEADLSNSITNQKVAKFEDVFINAFGEENPILQINKKQDNVQIKKALEKIKLKRKKNYFTIPYGDVDISDNRYKHNFVTKRSVGSEKNKDDSNFYDPGFEMNIDQNGNDTADIKKKRDILHQHLGYNYENRYNYLLQPQVPYQNLKNPHKGAYYDNFNRFNDVNLPTTERVNRIPLYHQREFLNKVQHVKPQSVDADKSMSYFENPNFVKVMKKQTYLMGKLLEILEQEDVAQRTRKSDFDKLLESIESHRNRNLYLSSGEGDQRITEKGKNYGTPTTGKPTTTRMSTVMALIDETAVRRALRKDPLIQRILKITGKRRADYFRKIQLANSKKKQKTN